jgi:hypothetical protein
LTPSTKVFATVLISAGDPLDQFGFPPGLFEFETLDTMAWAGTPEKENFFSNENDNVVSKSSQLSEVKW